MGDKIYDFEMGLDSKSIIDHMHTTITYLHFEERSHTFVPLAVGLLFMMCSHAYVLGCKTDSWDLISKKSDRDSVENELKDLFPAMKTIRNCIAHPYGEELSLITDFTNDKSTHVDKVLATPVVNPEILIPELLKLESIMTHKQVLSAISCIKDMLHVEPSIWSRVADSILNNTESN